MVQEQTFRIIRLTTSKWRETSHARQHKKGKREERRTREKTLDPSFSSWSRFHPPTRVGQITRPRSCMGLGKLRLVGRSDEDPHHPYSPLLNPGHSLGPRSSDKIRWVRGRGTKLMKLSIYGLGKRWGSKRSIDSIQARGILLQPNHLACLFATWTNGVTRIWCPPRSFSIVVSA